MLTAALCIGIVAIAALAWPVIRLGAWARTMMVSALTGLVAGSAWLLPAEATIERACVVILAAAFACKIATLGIERDWWARRSWRDWLRGLANLGVLLPRLHEGAPAGGRVTARSVRAVIQVAIGVALLVWAFGFSWAPEWIVVEHLVKLLAGYVAVLDGAFLLSEAESRLKGFRVLPLTQDPILAVTPADFWRRYNIEAGRFLRESIYRPLARRIGRTGAIFGTFLFNGVMHEYLMWVIIGRIEGYQLAFFALQGGAVALTWRLRPRTAGMRWFARALTFAFMAASSTLFLASAQSAFGWWSVDLSPW